MSALANPVTSFCNGVIPFIWDRLPLGTAPNPLNGRPCLEEDYFVADLIDAGSPLQWRGRDAETSHRLLYRYARHEAHKRGEYGTQPHWLLWHQMVILFPTLFAVADQIHKQQREAQS